MQRVIADLYALITRREGGEKDALIPVLIGFALVLATLPVVRADLGRAGCRT